MESYSKINKIINSNKTFFTSKDIGSILEIAAIRTIENNISKMIDSGIITQLEKGKYILSSRKVMDFEIAQFVYSPSYISLETALNLYGILSQFPYEITSVTLRKTASKTIQGKTFTYSQLKKSLYSGYVKKDNYLIATPEKALFDYLYLISKSIRSDSYLNELDFTIINIDKVVEFIKLTSKKTADKINEYINKYL